MKSRPPFLLPVSLLTIIIISLLITGTANAQTYTVLYKFQGGKDGGAPHDGLVRDSAGNLYGTTSGIGAHSYGTIFMLDSAGNETVLYRFTGGADGKFPYAGLVLDSVGNLYGTTYEGGIGIGTIFRLDSSGIFTVLHTFGDLLYDGAYPMTRMIRDADGNLYGTTYYAGANGHGTIFKLDSSGNYSILYSLTGGTDGGSPDGPLVRDSQGNFYGVTKDNFGTVFKLDSSGVLTTLYVFTGGADGSGPIGGLVRDGAGNLYGATAFGGDFTCNINLGCGVVFKVDPYGNETVLHAFGFDPDAMYPWSGLLADGKGSLYGTSAYGVYKVDIATGSDAVGHCFGPNANGWQPYGTLIGDRQGNMYGTTLGGGAKTSLCQSGCGLVYKISTH